MRLVWVRHSPAAARAAQSRSLSTASQRSALSQIPTLHPLRAERAQRSCTVHDVLHSAAIRAGSSAHLPSSDHSTQRALRSIRSPFSASHASHSARHVDSMNAGLREHSPCRA